MNESNVARMSREEDDNDDLVLNQADPLQSARLFIDHQYSEEGIRTLHHYSGMFSAWNGACYPDADLNAVRSGLYDFLENASRQTKDGNEPFQPNTHKVNDVMDALKAAANLDKTVMAPAWLDQNPDLNAEDMLACKNGLLHLPDRKLMPATPLFWTPNALSYDFDPGALDPVEWLRFLGSVWEDDQDSIDTLQEMFGYLLTADAQQQKVFMVVGPKRSGKGTIARILTTMLGQANVCNPTLASLSTQFGLQPLIGKLAAIIADARLGGRADQHAIAERLLSVSGEDGQTIDRKHTSSWTGRLGTRFLLMTNELPRLADASGALASRFIIMRMTTSFYGREDQCLTNRLMKELPGILNWALDGRDRLQERGFFLQPKSAASAVQELEDLSSPISAFVRDRCVVDPAEIALIASLYSAWKSWCEEQGRDYTGTVATFGRELNAALPGLDVVQPREYNRKRCYQGVGLQ
jgi:putative DNA primase/helicase